MEGKKKTKYQRAQAAATNYCKTGTPAAKERRDNAFKSYKADALKKGKTTTAVNETISRMMKCDLVGAKKKTTRKVSTKRKK